MKRQNLFSVKNKIKSEFRLLQTLLEVVRLEPFDCQLILNHLRETEILRGSKCQSCFDLTSEMVSTLKEKKLLPFRANSFLL